MHLNIFIEFKKNECYEAEIWFVCVFRHSQSVGFFNPKFGLAFQTPINSNVDHYFWLLRPRNFLTGSLKILPPEIWGLFIKSFQKSLHPYVLQEKFEFKNETALSNRFWWNFQNYSMITSAFASSTSSILVKFCISFIPVGVILQS